MKTAVILVDLQVDFMPGGALAVTQGDKVVPVANALLARSGLYELVVATQDWHPRGHGSFASSHPGRRPGEVIKLHGLDQVLWPDHCVQGTLGAELHRDLHLPPGSRVFPKGEDPTVDSYSGFFDNGRRRATGLGDYLKDRGVGRVLVMGLATDYCVRWTALDARSLGLETVLLEDGCRGVELKAGDCGRALAEMKAAGIRLSSLPGLA